MAERIAQQPPDATEPVRYISVLDKLSNGQKWRLTGLSYQAPGKGLSISGGNILAIFCDPLKNRMVVSTDISTPPSYEELDLSQSGQEIELTYRNTRSGETATFDNLYLMATGFLS